MDAKPTDKEAPTVLIVNLVVDCLDMLLETECWVNSTFLYMATTSKPHCELNGFYSQLSMCRTAVEMYSSLVQEGNSYTFEVWDQSQVHSSKCRKYAPCASWEH